MFAFELIGPGGWNAQPLSSSLPNKREGSMIRFCFQGGGYMMLSSLSKRIIDKRCSRWAWELSYSNVITVEQNLIKKYV